MTNFDDPVRRPRTGELEVIVAIADTGSLGAAAAELGCTQSRISHALGEVEAVIGARLFERSRVGSHPTAVGEAVLARAREALQLLDAIARPRDLQALMGTVCIAAYRSVATHLVTPLAHALTQARPGIRVEIDDSGGEREDVERRVLDGRADLGIVHQPAAAGLAVTPFTADDYVIVVGRAHRPARGSLWEGLARLPLFELRCSGARAAVQACRQDGLRNRTAAAFSSDSTILAQIGARRGFSILPRLAIEPLPDSLQALPLPIVAFRSLVLIRRANRRSALLREVTAHMLAGMRRPGFPARKWLRP
jgi:DNA-binding transcriptional LysR family regulator